MEGLEEKGPKENVPIRIDYKGSETMELDVWKQELPVEKAFAFRDGTEKYEGGDRLPKYGSDMDAERVEWWFIWKWWWN